MEKETLLRLDQEALNTLNLDDTSSAFVARQLTHVRAQTIQVKHAALNAFTLFPVQTEIPVGADTAEQIYYDMVGMATIISNYADDLPRADVVAEKTAVSVRDIGSSYGYSVKELQNAAYAKVPLTTMKASAVKRSNDKKLNDVAFKGDSKYGITGFIDNANLNEYTLTADGTGSATKFSTKTAAQMFRDMTAFIESVPIATEYTEAMNTIGISPAAHLALASTTYNTTTGLTVLQTLKEQHPEITRWLKIGEFKNADATGTKDIMIGGYFDADYVRFEIPNRFEQRPVQERNLEYVVNCLSSTVGVTVFRPFAFSIAEGV
jgi:hypothetical protein